MMDRTQFVQFAAAQALHATSNGTQAREFAFAAKQSAEALADLLGLKEEPALAVQGSLDEIATLAGKVEELQRELAARARRIAELEQDLEKATAPKGKASR